MELSLASHEPSEQITQSFIIHLFQAKFFFAQKPQQAAVKNGDAKFRSRHYTKGGKLTFPRKLDS